MWPVSVDVSRICRSSRSSITAELFYLYPGTLDITPDDPRWIGAWWGGFLLCSALLFLSALFMFGFPQALDEEMEAGGESEQAMLPPSLSQEYRGSKSNGSFDINSGLSVWQHLRGKRCDQTQTEGLVSHF